MSHADRSMGGALRDLHLLRALAGHGHAVAAFRMHPGREAEEEAFLGGAVTARFLPSDDPRPIPHRQTSSALEAALLDFRPNVLILKGLGYAVNARAVAAVPGARHGFVVGGGVRDAALPGAAFVLGEYPAQLRRHFPEHADAGLVLPKYVEPPPEGPCPPPEHDVVNLGGLGDARKNQAALLPLTDRWRVALVGGGALSAGQRAALADPARLTLAGRLDRAGVGEVLRRSRIMVHPSTMDGLPRAVVEGMAAGLPVVVYRETIPGGFVEGAHGFMVSPATLRPAVELLLGEEGLRRAMGARARRHALAHHGVAAIERAAERLLRHLGAA